MNPDFNKNTIDTLAKRAAFMCSNPDCRVLTVGPNSDPEKSTKIGEAAHIYGARIGSKRYIHTMTDPARAEITNSIWLCRNCHKLIDTDEQKYSANILFAWREKHEEFISTSLGNNTDHIIYNEQISILKDFNNYSPIIKRIIIDKPDGWEYRLTAELMRFLNDPLFRKLNDLKDGLYLKPPENIDSGKAFNWIQDRLNELSRIVPPAVGLLDRLTKSWGKPGEPGDIKEIHHVTKLIKEYLEHIIEFEERIQFVNVPPEYQKAVHLLKNLIGSQIAKLSSIPADLDEILLFAENQQKGNENPKEIRKEFIIEIPDSWQKEFNKEINKLQNKQDYNTSSSSGCFTALIIMIGIIMFLLF
ncbi:HNH endonuclease [Flavobacterium sp. CF136]|uniref:HNH endonuclease n=1 Tax=Flavobacterium sp. (strain CF136) TaxID=1144313 RepID=UPI00027173B6|nr:HNH endonuclease [Flavobacterium sp. CF136]EJL65719.1 hypothetical protein PMI10_01025 [Flavobacterium sp. CF136]